MATEDFVFIESRQALRNWLLANQQKPEGQWIGFFKKSTGKSDLEWTVIVEECLCFGWIDSLPGKVDDERTKIYLSPRNPNSGWSRRNKNLVLDLQSRGLMQPSGIAAIEIAKRNGAWEKYDLAEDMIVPEDMLQILLNNPRRNEFWEALTDAKKRQILQQVYEAKTLETRIRRINKLVIEGH